MRAIFRDRADYRTTSVVGWLMTRRVRVSGFGFPESQRQSRRSEVGSRKSEVGSRKSEVGSRKWEVGSRKSEVGSRKSEVGSRKSEVGSRKSEVGKTGFEFFGDLRLTTVLPETGTRKPETGVFNARRFWVVSTGRSAVRPCSSTALQTPRRRGSS